MSTCRQSIAALMRETGLYAPAAPLIGCELEAYLTALEPLEERIRAVMGACLLPRASLEQLRRFERMLAIPVREQLPLEQRRKRALDRMTVGASDFHHDGMRRALRSAGIDAILREYPGTGTVTIVVKGEEGAILNLDEIKQAVQGLLPAHLEADFQTGGATWGEISALDWNWIRLEGMNKSWNQLEILAIEEWGG